MVNLSDYQLLIDKKAEENSSEILTNAGNKHAAIVMSKMFDKTYEQVNMVVGSFDGKVSDQDNYLKSLAAAIDREINFKIIFLDTPNENSKAYNLLKEGKSNNKPIVFKSADNDLKELLTKKQAVHFAVFDYDKYRFEKDTKNYLAFVCFSDKKHATALNELFMPAFERCPEV